MSSGSDFLSFAARSFASLDSSRGRRTFILEAADAYWTRLVNGELPQNAANLPSESILINVSDPLDFEDDQDGIVPKRGIIVRTDFSNDDKWTSFVESVLKSEHEGIAEMIASRAPVAGDQEAITVDSTNDEDNRSAEDDSEDEGAPGRSTTKENEEAVETDPESETFIIVDASIPSSPCAPLRGQIDNATNLTLLRLFDDLDVVTTLPIPAGKSRAKGSLGKSPTARLVDWYGFHEVFSGRLIWVYDAKSNIDGSARLIVQRPTTYGFPTGDSWRARASFIWELQLNLSSGTMSIDFGGEDRFDGSERQRNFDQLQGATNGQL